MIAILIYLLLIAGAGSAGAAPLIPIVAAATIGGITIGTAAATVLVYGGLAALSFGVSYVANKLLGKSEAASAQSTASGAVGSAQLNIRVAADVPQSLIVGRAVTAGSLAYAGTYGSLGTGGNDRLIEIIALADHPCEALVEVHVEGQQRELIPSGAEYIVGADVYGGNVTMRFHDGSQTAADPVAVFAFGAATNPWSDDHIGIGRSYSRMSSIYAKDYVSGRLPFKFVIDGIRLYDPRKDTTVGGSGSHRYDQLATHEWTENVAVIIYNIARGIYVADAGNERQFFYGMGAAADQLPLSNWFAAMNECDVPIALEAGGTEPQFVTGGEFSVDTEPREAIKALLDSCGGRFSETGGIFSLHIGAPGLPVISITDDDLVDREESLRPVVRLQDRVNYVTAKFTSPTDGWIDSVAPAVTNSLWEAEDGRRVSANLDLPTVHSSTQAQRVQTQLLNRARRGRKHLITLPPAAFGIEPGDVFEWNSARNGYVDKLFEVDTAAYDTLLNTQVACTEVDPTDYDWSSAFEQPQPSGSIITARPDPKIIGGFDAAAFIYSGDLGTNRPAIRITWNDPGDGDVGGLTYELRRTVYPSDVTRYTSLDHDVVLAGELVILGGLQSLTEYDVRAKFISDNNYAADWSLWLTVETPDARFTSDDLYAGLRDWVDGQVAAELAEIRAELADVSLSVANALAMNWVDKKLVRSDIVASEGRSTASVSTLQTALANDEAAFAAYQITITSQFADVNAAITSESATRSSQDTAIANSVSSLTTTVNANTAAISSEQTARTTQDTALSNSITSLTTTVTNNYNTLNAAITSEINTRSTQDTALSNSIVSLTATVDGHTASITTAQSAIATINGHLTASWGVTLDVNNKVTGIRLLSDGSTGVFAINANVIVDGSITATKIAASAIDATKIAVNGVDILNIVDGAATALAYASGSDVSISLTNTASTVWSFSGDQEATLASVSLTPKYGIVRVDLQTVFQYLVQATNDYQGNDYRPTWYHVVELLVNGNVTKSYTISPLWRANQDNELRSDWYCFKDFYRSYIVSGLGTSPVTFSMRTKLPASNYGPALSFTHSQNLITVFERRR